MTTEVDYKCEFNHDYSKCECDNPYLDVVLSFNEIEFPVVALVDSGCTITHVNAEVADFFGIDLSTCTEVETTGISGKCTAYLFEIDFYIEGEGAKFVGPVLFVKDLPVATLLGQKNFFEKFDVHFKKSQGKFIINRV